MYTKIFLKHSKQADFAQKIMQKEKEITKYVCNTYFLFVPTTHNCFCWCENKQNVYLMYQCILFGSD